MSWHTAPPGSPQAKQLSHLQAQLLLGPRCDSQHTYIYIYLVSVRQGHFRRVQVFVGL